MTLYKNKTLFVVVKAETELNATLFFFRKK